MPASMTAPRRHQLDELEAEAIYILREVVAQLERPALLFSGGKDSTCLVHLARKAFSPLRPPFPFLHIDTGHNFEETLEFRDRLAARTGAELLVRSVQQTLDEGRAVEERGPNASRNALQTTTLLDAIAELRLDAVIGGARRDEEKARAKERVFSRRDELGQWDPKAQRPELWRLYNGRVTSGEHVRVFPLSNWTELDVWRYVEREGIELPSLYFAHEREVIRKRDGSLLAASPWTHAAAGDTVERLRVRFRTVGDMTCTGAVVSSAASVDEVIAEVESARTTERGTRADDRRSETAMEDRKRQGYF